MTLNVTLIWFVIVPLFPVTNTRNDPLVDELQLRVAVPDVPSVMILFESEQIRPVEIVSLTVPWNPSMLDTVMVELPFLLTLTLTGFGLADIEKSSTRTLATRVDQQGPAFAGGGNGRQAPVTFPMYSPATQRTEGSLRSVAAPK